MTRGMTLIVTSPLSLSQLVRIANLLGLLALWARTVPKRTNVALAAFRVRLYGLAMDHVLCTEDLGDAVRQA